MKPLQTDLEDWLAAQEPHLPHSVRLRRIELNNNMARFYRVAVQPDLFGVWCFIREWGRIGRGGQIRVTSYPTPAEAHTAFAKQRQAKERRGYVRG